jgi:hypothetical protein
MAAAGISISGRGVCSEFSDLTGRSPVVLSTGFVGAHGCRVHKSQLRIHIREIKNTRGNIQIQAIY